jgi:DNA-3-methyladenine glycosylase
VERGVRSDGRIQVQRKPQDRTPSLPANAGGAVEETACLQLAREFYARPAAVVARALLGCMLVQRLKSGRLIVARIVETEAYIGEHDRACHAHRGLTPRTQTMYGPAGHAYVYFIYGVHDMLNVVCQPEGRPEAVLLRAAAPQQGIAIMRRRRGMARDRDLARGPGRLCRAFAITRADDGTDLCSGSRLWIAPGGLTGAEKVLRTPRIGVDYAGADALRLLRFVVAGDPHVSRSAQAAPAAAVAARRRARRAAI